MKPAIGICFGGNTIEADFSKQSASFLYKQLRMAGYDVQLIDVAEKDWLKCIMIPKIDLLIDLVYGCPGQEGCIKGVAELQGIKYLGSNQFTYSTVKDKYITKLLAEDNGISTPEYITFSREEYESSCRDCICQVQRRIGSECVVKPRQKGGLSIGIAYCNDEATLENAINEAFKYDDVLLVERYLRGVEISSCVVNIKGNLEVLPLIEVRLDNGTHICDFEAKRDLKRKIIIPAEISSREERDIKRISLKLFKKLQARDFCYFDFIIDKDVGANFIEAGVVPGLTKNSNLTVAMKQYGLSIGEFFDQLISQRM